MPRAAAAGRGPAEVGRDEDALIVREADLSLMRRVGASKADILIAQANLGNTYERLGRYNESLSTAREVYAGFNSIYGNCDTRTLMAASNLVYQLQTQGKHTEAVSTLRKPLSDARRALGDDHDITLSLGSLLGDSLARVGTSPTVSNLHEAIAILEDVCKRSRRLLGGSHPHTDTRQRALDDARRFLAHHFPEEE